MWHSSSDSSFWIKTSKNRRGHLAASVFLLQEAFGYFSSPITTPHGSMVMEALALSDWPSSKERLLPKG
jgi:hypothetical protein